MGKLYKILSLTALLVLLTGCSVVPSDYDALPDPTQTAQPTETPLPTETPTPTPEPEPAPVNYWASGLKVEDISTNTQRNCTYDMCVILKLTALKTCSSITLEGIVYNVEGYEVDDFSDDLPRLAKGKTRIVEFGSDAIEDDDDEIELDGWTCWK
jgi:hypothetical protein